MSLETHLNAVLDSLLKNPLDTSISKEQLIECMDLTLLDENASPESLNWVLAQGQSHPLACICVYDKHLPWFKSVPVPLATVVNFPKGKELIESCLETIDNAYKNKVQEIDYVFPYATYLSNKKEEAFAHCAQVVELYQKRQLRLKIILEICAFPNMTSIYEVSHELIRIGCDYLKTSTGKGVEGASLSGVFAMLCAIKESDSNCGIKISGGIKTLPQALMYARLAQLLINKKIDASWFRIGASSLLNDLLTQAN